MLLFVSGEGAPISFSSVITVSTEAPNQLIIMFSLPLTMLPEFEVPE